MVKSLVKALLTVGINSLNLLAFCRLAEGMRFELTIEVDPL